MSILLQERPFCPGAGRQAGSAAVAASARNLRLKQTEPPRSLPAAALLSHNGCCCKSGLLLLPAVIAAESRSCCLRPLAPQCKPAATTAANNLRCCWNSRSHACSWMQFQLWGLQSCRKLNMQAAGHPDAKHNLVAVPVLELQGPS